MKTALITGTTKGLGLELLKVFLANNWKVFALARKTEILDDLTTQYYKKCIPIEGDVTKKHTSDLIETVLAKHTKRLDLLINNAGNAKKCFGFTQVSPNDLDNHFKVHVSGVYRVIKASFPYLINATEPIIVNISSRKGSISKINSGEFRILYPYQVAKSAQNMLTAGLNQELSQFNIKVYAVHPGNLKTDVAPPDADTEPDVAAVKLFEWINKEKKPPTGQFYNIMEDTVIEW